MQRLGLDNKLNEELRLEVAKLKEENARLEKQHAQDQADLKQAKENIKSLSAAVETDKIADYIEKYSEKTCEIFKKVLDKLNEHHETDLAQFFLDKLKERDKVLSGLIKRLNYLSLLDTKKSEIHNVKDENGLSEGQTIDKKNPTIKHPKVEDAKSRGNNGAKHDPHNEVPNEENVITVFPNGYNPDCSDRFQTVERKRRVRLIFVSGYVRKQYYDVVKMYDKLQQVFLPAPKVPGTIMKGSIYDASLVSDFVVNKYGWFMPTTIMVKRYQNIGFNANMGTINGIISKVAESLFFRNLDTVLRITILQTSYMLMDETFGKVRTDFAKIDGEFIKECWFWGMYAVALKLIRYSCDDTGSRNDEVGYNLIEPVDHNMKVQTDRKSCYKNFEQKNQHIERLSCVQHQKRKFVNLKDPRAKKILALFSNIYHQDHIRCKLAKKDACDGREWSIAEHI